SKGIDKLLLAAAANEPRLLGALGRSIPSLRNKLAWQAIRRSAITSGVITLTPLPLIDFIPLTVVQITMVITISRIYGQPIGKARAIEMLGSLGFGLAGRTAFQELVKLGGPPGWAISASVAIATTVAIGYCTINWFAKGIVPTTASFKAMVSDVQKRLHSLKLFNLRKRPSSQKIKEGLDTHIQHLTEDLSKATSAASPPANASEKAEASDQPKASDEQPPAPRASDSA
ncbi:DUF697 domain-containing protein, partial [bacterium]|nr:DUF697 domain-containing protein [bacterium]